MLIIIKGAPVPKGRPRFARRGKFVSTYTPAKTVEHETMVRNEGIKSMNGASPTDAPVRVNVDCFMPIPKSTSKINREMMLEGVMRHTKKPDIDNLAKGYLDALNGVVWLDDSQIVRLVVTKEYSDQPRCEIMVIEDCL